MEALTISSAKHSEIVFRFLKEEARAPAELREDVVLLVAVQRAERGARRDEALREHERPEARRG